MKSDRIKPIANHADKKEQDAVRVFVAAQKDVEQAEAQLLQLQNYRDEYSRQLVSVSFNAERLRDYQLFVAKLNQAIDQTKIDIENKRRICEVKKQSWLKCRSRSHALNWVVEKYESEELRAEERREQKEMDEHAARTHNTKNKD
jgi:flagellar FliJ protein